ncbi:MAG: hypothetical protein ACLPVY_10775 [Acidimicrobiia bacterium]
MSSRRLAVLLGLALLIAVGPIVGADTAQPASRYSLTASIAEHGTIDIARYHKRLGVDHAIYKGHLRSDKGPGQPFLAVPVYLVGRAFGAESALHARVFGDLGLWWDTLWSATVPFVVLVALMFLLAEKFARRNVAAAVALMVGVCTMMLEHAVNLYAHDLAALFAFGAWIAIDEIPLTAPRAALAGFLAGMAVLTEYESGIILTVLAVYLLVRQRNRIGWFALGVSAPLAVLAWYQWRAFGAPWHTPSAYYAGVLNGTTRGGYSIPNVHDLGAVLFGNRGLVIGAPIAFIGLIGAGWLLASGPSAARRHAIVAFAVVVPYLVLCAGWSGLPLLEEPGPRYLIPALPFLAVPLAATWDRLWRPMLLAALIGAAISVPDATTYILLRPKQPAFPELFRRVRVGEFLPTLWSMAFGRAGIVLYGVSVVVAVAWVVRAWREPERTGVRPAAVGEIVSGR